RRQLRGQVADEVSAQRLLTLGEAIHTLKERGDLLLSVRAANERGETCQQLAAVAGAAELRIRNQPSKHIASAAVDRAEDRQLEPGIAAVPARQLRQCLARVFTRHSAERECELITHAKIRVVGHADELSADLRFDSEPFR